MKTKKVLLLSAGFILVVFLPAFSQVISPASNVIYVKKDATGNGSGSSWNDAVRELADALKWARDNQSGGLWSAADPLQIWVAKGTYKPLYTHNDAAGTSPPILNSFVLVRDVAVYGGFKGTEGTLAARTDWKTNQTVLSGALEVPYAEGGNSYTSVCHVVVAAGPAGNATLDGFTVTSGKAAYYDFINVNGFLTDAASGGGIYLTESYPVLRNLIVTGNSADYNGGGIYMQSVLSNTTVLPLTGLLVTGNTAAGKGGGIYQDRMRLATHNCGFTGNIGKRGAAFYSDFSSLAFVNTLIAGNHADEGVVVGGQTTYSYGAVYLKSSNLDVINTTISANKGGPIYTLDGGNVISVRNSIVTGHNLSISGLTESRITNSIVQFITTIAGSNLAGTTNPQFVSGRTYNDAPFTNGDYRLKLTSPVVDKGANASYPGSLSVDTDLAGRPRLRGALVDMGAYEGGYDPLPVKLVYFRAEKEQAQVQLKWAAAVEVNVSHFEVQRGADGRNFNAVGTVAATGDSDKLVRYQFSDSRINAEPVTYYRIRTIDRDDSYEFSQVIAVKWGNTGGSTGRLSPNPAGEGRVSFEAGEQNAEIVVVDLLGQKVKVSAKETLNGVYELDLSNLNAGVYLVQAFTPDGVPLIVSRLLVK